MRSPLTRVRGLGSAHDGTNHWIALRLTSLALIPLGLWFVISLVMHTGASFQEFKAWVHSFPVALGLILLLVVTFWHASLGLQVIVEDYVHNRWAFFITLILIKFACFALGAAGILSVLLIALR